MNEIIMPPDRDSRNIKKRIDSTEIKLILKAIKKYLEEGDPCKPFGRRIDSYKNQYRIPEYRLRSGDYRVMYNVEDGFFKKIVYVLDIIHKKESVIWLKKHGVKK